jgi:hypothetical protein
MSPARSSSSMAAPEARRPDAPGSAILATVLRAAKRHTKPGPWAAGGKRRGGAGDRVRLGWAWRGARACGSRAAVLRRSEQTRFRRRRRRSRRL